VRLLLSLGMLIGCISPRSTLPMVDAAGEDAKANRPSNGLTADGALSIADLDGPAAAAPEFDGRTNRDGSNAAGPPDSLPTIDAPPVSFSMTVYVASVAGGSGTISLTPSGTSCGVDCFSYPRGQTVSITASPTAPSLFAAWSGDCAGQGPVCTLTLSAIRTTTAHFRANLNMMFVTSTDIVPSSIGSTLAAADAFCVDRARAGFLGGSNWKAWLATSPATTNITAPMHVGISTVGWIRRDGRPVAVSTASLLTDGTIYPPSLTELAIDRADFVAAGLRPDGTADPANNCSDWTSASGSMYLGDSVTPRSWAVSYPAGGCSNQYPVYCFENDSGMAHVLAPAQVPAGARRAFVSRASWLPCKVSALPTCFVRWRLLLQACQTLADFGPYSQRLWPPPTRPALV